MERRRIARDAGARNARLLGERRPEAVDDAAMLGALADRPDARRARTQRVVDDDPALRVRRSQFERALADQLAALAGRAKVELPVKVTERLDRTLADLKKRYPRVVGIDRDAKVLRLYKNLRLEKRHKVAVGKAGLESSAGRYEIVDPPWHTPNKAWAGDRAGKTIPAGDPRNPLGARWLGYHDGEGIHGTADIESLGTSASHGCIRMSPDAVKELYGLVKVGTPVFMQ